MLQFDNPFTRKKARKTPNEQEDVRQIRDGFTASRNERARLGIEREMVLNTQMYEGGAGQWYAWNANENKAYNMLPKADRDICITTNFTKPLVVKAKALATTTKPDATAEPASQSPRDIAAAEEAPFITAQVYRDFGGYQSYVDKQAENLIVLGAAYAITPWDAYAKAAIPETDEQTNEFLGRKMARVGAVDLKVLPPHMVYFNAGARDYASVREVYIAEVVSYDELVQQFGSAARHVKPDQASASSDWGAAYLPGYEGGIGGIGGNGALFGSSDPANRGCLKITRFSLPTVAHPDDKEGRDYPEGRHVVIAGDKRLYDGPLPYGDGKLPLIRQVYSEAANHPYGIGIVSDMRSPQQEYNRARTKMIVQAEARKNILLLDSMVNADPEIAEIVASKGFYKTSSRTTETVVYNTVQGGDPPSIIQTPPADRDLFEIMASAKENLQDIIGVHDVNMGAPPAGVTAGNAIELLQQGDTRQISQVTARLEQLIGDTNTQGVQCFGKYASSDLPRLVGLDDSGDPQIALTRALSFQAVCDGGQVEFVFTPGSATPKTPAGERQEAYDLIGMNLLDPANPQARTGLVALGYTQNSRIMRAFNEAEARMKDEQAKQAQAAQAQMQAEQQAAQMATANQAPPTDPAQIEQMRQAGAAQSQQAKAESDAQMVQMKTEADLVKGEQAHNQQMERDDLQVYRQAQMSVLSNAFKTTF